MKINLTEIKITEAEKNAVMSVLDSGMLASGPKVAQLEQDFRELCHCKQAIAVSNGTAALHTALYAAGIKPGDEVITTPFTFIATANSILMAGATPVFADIDPTTFNLSAKKVEEKVTKKTKAVIVVDLYGQPADWDEFRDLAKKYKLTLISDSAQSIGSLYKNIPTGGIADITTFSLYATKNIMCGEGGAITTNSDEVADKARLFRHHGQSETKRYYYEDLGYNYRLTDMQAALAVEQLKNCDEITEKRQTNAAFLNNELKSVPGIMVPQIANNRTHAFHQYTIRVTDEYGMSRDNLQSKLSEDGIAANIYYPLPLYKVDHLSKNQAGEAFPITETVTAEVLSLPVHPYLTKLDLEMIVEKIKKYAKR